MSRHRMGEMLETGTVGVTQRCFPSGGSGTQDGEAFTWGWQAGTPTASAAGWAKGALNVDTTNGIPYYNSGSLASATWTSLLGGGVTLDAAFDNGKVINGANSAANAFAVGDGTDAILFHTEAAGDVRITTDGTSNLTIAPDGGDTAITGTLTVSGLVTASGALTVVGALSAGSISLDALAAATAGATLTLDGHTSGAVNIGSISTGGITLSDDVAVVAGKTLTAAGTAGSNVFSVTAGDAVLSDGSLAITDADNAASLSVTNNTITSSDLVTIDSTSLTTGNALKITADAITSGSLIYLDSSAAGFTGEYILCYDGAAQDFAVKVNGEVEIAGSDTADMITVTKGNLQLDDGIFEVDVDSDQGNYIKRNQGATTKPLLEIEETATAADNACLLIDHKATGAVDAMQITHDGTGSGLNITGTAVTSTQLTLVGPASQTTSSLLVDGATGSWIGGAAVGMLHLKSDGAVVADGSLLHIASSGQPAAANDGVCLDIVETGAAQATSYAVRINSTNNEAFHVDAGESLFDEVATFAGGVTVNDSQALTLGSTNGPTATWDGANDLNIDAAVANDNINFGSVTDTDVVFHGGTGGADASWIAATDTMTFAAAAQLVATGNGTGTGLAIPFHATNTPSDTVQGSIFFEVDAKKLWVYDGTGWVGTVLS